MELGGAPQNPASVLDAIEKAIEKRQFPLRVSDDASRGRRSPRPVDRTGVIGPRGAACSPYPPAGPEAFGAGIDPRWSWSRVPSRTDSKQRSRERARGGRSRRSIPWPCANRSGPSCPRSLASDSTIPRAGPAEPASALESRPPTSASLSTTSRCGNNLLRGQAGLPREQVLVRRSPAAAIGSRGPPIREPLWRMGE